ncbi:MAG: PASTA domain-containing protein [Candidatus Riflebacteria bacterium]|nr:PASTA domain-containing protein [Candidatus Riflebacteria bacterium]
MIRLIKIVSVLGLLALLGYGGYLYGKQALDSYFNRGSVMTPSLVGKTIEEAVEATNLPVKIASRVTSNDVPVGRVITQDPPGGTPVHVGKPILVVLSRGADLVEVPSVVGQTARKAKLTLSEAKLGVGQVCAISSEQPKDTVVNQYPASSGKLGKSGLVDLLVSQGPSATPAPVPRVVGLDEGTARTTLEKLGFAKVDVVEKPAGPGIEVGTVTEQDPFPGAASSTRLILTVAREPATPTTAESPAVDLPVKRFTVDFAMPPGLTPKRLDVYQSENGQSRRSVYSRLHLPGEKVPIPVEGAGTIELEFYVDSVAFGREQF